MSLPYSLLVWLDRGFRDPITDLPLAGGKIESFVSGSEVTHKNLFADPLGVTPLSNPAILDSAGRITAFMSPGGYDFDLFDSNGVFKLSVESVQDVGATFLSTLGTQFATGAKNVVSGYSLLATDNFITVNSTGGPSPCIVNLGPVLGRGQPVGIKNVGTIALSVVPNGADTIENSLASYTVPAAASPSFPAIILLPDGVSTWWLWASHKNP